MRTQGNTLSLCLLWFLPIPVTIPSKGCARGPGFRNAHLIDWFRRAVPNVTWMYSY